MSAADFKAIRPTARKLRPPPDARRPASDAWPDSGGYPAARIHFCRKSRYRRRRGNKGASQLLMAKIPLKLDELIDGAALRRDLAALAASAEGDGRQQDGARPGASSSSRRRSPPAAATAERMLMEDGGGTACAARLSHLMDEIIRALYDFAATHVYRSKNPSAGRAHGGGGGRRLRPRHAGAGLRHRPAVPAALQADAVGRAGRRIHALHAVGSRAEGRPRHPQHRRVHPPVARRHHHPHLDPGGALPVGRRSALRRADRSASTARW